jgi:outer membrane lipoprotein-sorting protein
MVRRLAQISVAAAGLLMLAAWCGAVDFSADTVTKVGKMNLTGKVYRQGKKIRQETAMGGVKQIAIVRPDKKVVWVIFPATKTYMEMPQTRDMDVSRYTDFAALKKYGAIKSLGRANVCGYVCDKTLFIANDKRLGTSTMWVSKELQWPLRVESKGPHGLVVVDSKNIKTGPLSPALFEIPKGYKKQAMPNMPMMPRKNAPGRGR